jgi:hypothetical protein
MKKKRTDLLIFFAVVTVLFVYINWQFLKNKTNLKHHKLLSTAIVTDVRPVIKGTGTWIEYEFRVRGITIEDKYRIFLNETYTDTLKKLFLNNYLPLIYDSTNLNNSVLLIERRDFETFNIPIPDSLMKTMEILKNLGGK